MAEKNDFFVQVTLTPEQARVVVNALDVLTRIHIGQFNIIREEFFGDFDSRLVDKLLFEARRIIFPSLGAHEGASHGITGCPTEKGKIAWDVLQVIRQTEALGRNPEGGHYVQYSNPMFTSESFPRPVAKPINVLDKLADL